MSDELAGELPLALAVARRYYLGDESKIDIGRALGISRFKVARLLALARTAGLVQIDIRAPAVGRDVEAETLCYRYALRECHIVRGVGRDGTVAALAEVAAALLERIVTADDVLGLPWSRTGSCAVQALRHLPRVPVVQLTGSLITPGQSTPFDMVRTAATLSGGEEYLFHAPLIMPTAEGASSVRNQEDVVRAFEAARDVTVTLCSVGAWSAGASSIFDRVSEQDRACAGQDGVVAETMGILLGEDGKPRSTELGRRLITIKFERLQAVRTVVATSHGLARLAATRAVLRSGVVDHLVVDGVLADALIAADPGSTD